jgi:hypothetical protein
MSRFISEINGVSTVLFVSGLVGANGHYRRSTRWQSGYPELSSLLPIKILEAPIDSAQDVAIARKCAFRNGTVFESLCSSVRARKSMFEDGPEASRCLGSTVVGREVITN